MTDALAPCPFCGGKPYLANVDMVGCSYVVCTDCRAQGDDASRERAIAAWNRRADLSPALAAAAMREAIIHAVYKTVTPLAPRTKRDGYARIGELVAILRVVDAILAIDLPGDPLAEALKLPEIARLVAASATLVDLDNQDTNGGPYIIWTEFCAALAALEAKP